MNPGDICKDDCPVGYYSDSSSICQRCDISCKTCFNAGSTSCSSCKLRNYLNPNKSCKTSCPTHYFINSSNQKCE